MIEQWPWRHLASDPLIIYLPFLYTLWSVGAERCKTSTKQLTGRPCSITIRLLRHWPMSHSTIPVRHSIPGVTVKSRLYPNLKQSGDPEWRRTGTHYELNCCFFIWLILIHPGCAHPVLYAAVLVCIYNGCLLLRRQLTPTIVSKTLSVYINAVASSLAACILKE